MSDYSEIKKAQERLENAVREINQLTAAVASAKQIREYDPDRRKNLLATYMLPSIKAGKSAVAAETEARADQSYQERLGALADQREASEHTIAKWDAAFAKFEGARSMNSALKETIKTI
jgi:hypothetical protein